jgi:hypothetical protein
MSALGQKRTWRDQIAMSTLPPIADIPRRNINVRFGPIADIGPLLDHLVSAGEYSRRHGEVKCFGSSKIDNCFVFVWRLHGKIRGFLSLKNAIYITSRLPVLVDLISSIGVDRHDGDCQAGKGQGMENDTFDLEASNFRVGEIIARLKPEVLAKLKASAATSGNDLRDEIRLAEYWTMSAPHPPPWLN